MDGLLKDRGNYEAFRPEELGRTHHLVLGKHSGSHGVCNAYAQLGVGPQMRTEAGALLERIRAHVTATKRAPSDAELLRFHAEAVLRAPATA